MRCIHVHAGKRTYPIFIGKGILAQAGVYFKQQGIVANSKVLVVTDHHVAPLYLSILERALQGANFSVCSFIIGAGEKSKSLAGYEQVITAAFANKLDRSSTIVALGGGVVGDIAGFVAATYMRGISFVQVPTTILAHDSSLGGKVGINYSMAKNIIGAFHHPIFILYDIDTLCTLPTREVISGLAEMLKHGLICDAPFAFWCTTNREKLIHLDQDALLYGLEKSCSIKASIVGEDELEQGKRALLNFGHTIGHALEMNPRCGTLSHGQAIAIGMAGAAFIGYSLYGELQVYREIIRMLRAFDLPTMLPISCDIDQTMSSLMGDKKFRQEQLSFIVLKKIGCAEMRTDVSLLMIRQALEQLKQKTTCKHD